MYNNNIKNAAMKINVAHSLTFRLLGDDVGRYAFNNEYEYFEIK